MFRNYNVKPKVSARASASASAAPPAIPIHLTLSPPFSWTWLALIRQIAPKKANRAHLEVHDGMLDWHLDDHMTFRDSHSFMMFGRVEKEWLEDGHEDLEVYAFVKNATGCLCWEDHIEVEVLPRNARHAAKLAKAAQVKAIKAKAK
jgi:hypothetical protein